VVAATRAAGARQLAAKNDKHWLRRIYKKQTCLHNRVTVSIKRRICPLQKSSNAVSLFIFNGLLLFGYQLSPCFCFQAYFRHARNFIGAS